MKHHRLFGVGLGLALLLSGCAGHSPQPEACGDEYDYGRGDNWVVNSEGQAAEFDLFYLYPTLVVSKDHALMDWRKFPKQAEKAHGFVSMQLRSFRPEGSGVYAPFVRQLELSRCLKYLEMGDCDWDRQPVRTGIDDTVRAFRYYLEHYNHGRPYILIGHSQGAVDLFRLLAHCPEITGERGFVAAYLLGLPRLSAAEIERELAPRGIRTARGTDDIGVVIGWNTQGKNTPKSVFTVPGAYAINPVSWRCDGPPCMVEGAFYLDRNLALQPVAEAFTVQVDAGRGALAVCLPEQSVYDGEGRMFGPGVMHGNDVFFFGEYIRRNMSERVRAWRQRYGVPVQVQDSNCIR